ncbi:MAG: phosphoglycerate dehydrogenase-like enzyme [Candidatus Azotimanducaceae bacterium]|jgi:phosphoglycerate dehydrogenase-like enzyme
MNILIVDERANEYRQHLTNAKHSFQFSTELPDNSVCDILLASPALAASALKSGARPGWIQSTWAGVESIVPTVKALGGIHLTGLKGIFEPLMSEYVFAYMLNDLRSISHFRNFQEQHHWNDQKMPGTLTGKSLAVLGTGSIGAHLSKTARQFGMKTIGVNRQGNPSIDFDVIETDILRALKTADYVVCCLPHTSQTIGVIDASCFSAMKDNAMFINVGRGSSVVEPALIEALSNAKIRCAIIDVFENEPLPTNSPLWELANLTVTPHISAPSFPVDVAKIFLDNLSRYEDGAPLRYEVDLDSGY